MHLVWVFLCALICRTVGRRIIYVFLYYNPIYIKIIIMKKDLLFCVVLTLFIMPVYVSAYLDPGTGSFIVQVAIAAVAGLLFTTKTYWNKVKIIWGGFFKKIFGQKKDEHK